MTFKSLESKNSDSVFNSFYFSLCVFFYFRFVYFNLAIFALKCHKYCLSIWAVRGVVCWESVNGSRKTTKLKKNESQEELEICNRIAIKKCHFDTCQFVFKWTFPPLLLMGHISLFFELRNKIKQSGGNISAKCQSLLKACIQFFSGKRKITTISQFLPSNINKKIYINFSLRIFETVLRIALP